MGWRWWRRRTEQPSNAVYSISDPAFAGYLGVGSDAGVDVTEGSALGLSAWYRGINLIAGTLAMLPMPTVRDVDGVRTVVRSVLDDPGGPEGPTPFEWKETAFLHLLCHGDAFLFHRYNQAGALYALELIHPLCVGVEKWVPSDGEPRPVGGKWFTVTLDDGQTVKLDARSITHIMGPSTDGIRGISPITAARHSLGTAIAGDRAAARMFSNGMLISGMVTPEEDVDETEAKIIKEALSRNMLGWDNAGEIAVINRRLKFTPWTMNAQDAQFLQSRQFSIEEVARWLGVPPHALMQTEKQTSWGTGVAEQNRGLSRTVLAPWATRFEQRLSRLLPAPRRVTFDFAGLERPTPEVETETLIKKVEAGLLTPNEARRHLNLPPIEGGDVLRGSTPPPAPPEPAPDDDRADTDDREQVDA